MQFGRLAFLTLVPCLFSCFGACSGGVCEAEQSGRFTCLENMDEDECTILGQFGLISYQRGTSCPELGYEHELPGGYDEYRRGPDDDGPGDYGAFAGSTACTGPACETPNSTFNSQNSTANSGTTNSSSGAIDGLYLSETFENAGITGETTILFEVVDGVPTGSCVFNIGTGVNSSGSIPMCINTFIDTWQSLDDTTIESTARDYFIEPEGCRGYDAFFEPEQVEYAIEGGVLTITGAQGSLDYTKRAPPEHSLRACGFE